jgi:hypothetical protein
MRAVEGNLGHSLLEMVEDIEKGLARRLQLLSSLLLTVRKDETGTSLIWL